MRRLGAQLSLLLIALPIIFHWRILTLNALDRGSFPTGDFAEQFYAFARFAYAELAQGRLPLWNPYTYAGHPFIADVQSAVFYPPSLLVMLISSFFGGFSLYALEWQAVLHFSLAGVFTFLFAHHELQGQNLSAARPSPLVPLAAFLSAVVFTFGGYLTAYPSQQLAILETDVWLPLILLFLNKAVQTTKTQSCVALFHSAARRVRHTGQRHQVQLFFVPLCLGGLYFGVALLAGHPQSALYVLMVSAAYMLFRGRQSGWRWRDIALRLLLMLAVALGVSAVQWIPGLEFMQQSSRSALTYADYARGFELQDPLQLLLPGSVSFYSPLYVGIVPLALVICAVWLPRRPHKVIVFWSGLALFALALSFGGNLFLYPILYLFAPGFALFRQQERAAFIFSFALALLAGYGALNLAHTLPRDVRGRLRSFARLAVGVLCGALIFFVLLYFGWMVAQLNRESPFRAASSQAAWLLLMLALLCGLLMARLHGRLKRTRLLLFIVIVAALDLFSVNWHTNFQPTPPEAQTKMPALLAPIIADQSLYRTFNEYRLFGNFGDTYHIEDSWGASPLRLARYEQFHKLPMERLWSLLNVKYVITWRKALNVPSEIVAQEKVSDTETTYVHRLLTVAPRAAMVTQVAVATSSDEALSRLAAPDFDFTQRAIVEAPFNPLPQSGLPRVLGGGGGQGGGAPTLVSRTASRSLWNVRTPTDALFVLSENYYPGWRAFVDGRETPIIRVNSVMMGVIVPAGSHAIVFGFDPLSVKLGAGISIATFVCLFVGWLVLRFNQRTNQPTTQPPNRR